MLHENQLPLLTLSTLVYRCRRETDRFLRREANDPRYGYELFRRALETPHTEESKDAWRFVEAVYKPLATRWAQRHWRFKLTGLPAQTFAEEGLARMWEIFAKSKGKFNAQDFPTLARLLAYLKLCVYTAVSRFPLPEYPEGEEIGKVSEPPPSLPLPPLRPLWDCIEKRLSNDLQRLVAYESFVKESKPSEIYADYPHLFESTDRVYKIKYSIIKKLRYKEEELRDCFAQAS